MNFFDSALVNRDRHILTPLSDAKRDLSRRAGCVRSAQTKQVQALLRRMEQAGNRSGEGRRTR